jgi:hypothetical protein
MSRPERGSTPQGFRRQLLARMRNQALHDGVSPQRLQQHLAFERLLARLPISGDWTLKGGFGLELRYGWTSRATQDIDLRTMLDPQEAFLTLQSILAESVVRDYFSFEIAGRVEPTPGAPGGSLRIPIVARLAGEVLDRFHIDLASGDALVGTPDLLTGSDMLSFAAVAPIQFPVYPVTQQLAEKLHAYTLPRTAENTRVKDFVDLIAIALTESVDGDRLVASVHATFDLRATHGIPGALPSPPNSWTTPFSRLVTPLLTERGSDLAAGSQIAARFWNPILAAERTDGHWNPGELIWESAAGEAGAPGSQPHQPQQPERDHN